MDGGAVADACCRPGRPTKGEIRGQFHHVVEMAPTVHEVARLPRPKAVNGVPQRPLDGASSRQSSGGSRSRPGLTIEVNEVTRGNAEAEP